LEVSRRASTPLVTVATRRHRIGCCLFSLPSSPA
jgi:hypothetical protein